MNFVLKRWMRCVNTRQLYDTIRKSRNCVLSMSSSSSTSSMSFAEAIFSGCNLQGPPQSSHTYPPALLILSSKELRKSRDPTTCNTRHKV